jgi:PAS domain S-box-containing protein
MGAGESLGAPLDPRNPASHASAPRSPCEEEARRLQAVLDALPVPIFFKDVRGAYLGFNDAFERYLGLPRARILGRTVFEIAPSDLAEVYRHADEELLRSGGTQVYETRVQWGDGTRREVVFHKAVLRDGGGSPAGLVGAMLDVSEQRAAERAHGKALETAESAQRLAAIGTLAAGIAHELNNPLTFVLSNVEVVADAVRRLPGGPGERDDWDEVVQALDDALEGAERMRMILRDLRTLARPDDRPGGASDVRKLLEGAAALASSEIRSRARLVWDVGDVPPVRGTEGRLGQVFVNLLVNAAQAIPEGDPGAHVIRLSAARSTEGGVAISVQDSGAGIAPAHLARVFDPFFTTKPVGLGTGLGLWVCQNIVTALGGSLSVESELGRGTTFRVVLPAAEGEPLRAPRPESARDGRPLRRVLVVDDEPLVASTIRRQLAAEFTVDTASGAVDALARVAAGRYEAVICDLVLEGTTGLEVIEAIRQADPALAARVLLVTGGASRELGERLARSGHRWIAKPFDGRLLRDALRELLAG